LKIKTAHLGEIEADESRIIEIRGGILGFEDQTRFIMIDDNESTPFMWLQSLDREATAFIVINPFLVVPRYAPEISDNDGRSLELNDPAQAMVIAIATLRRNPFRISVNLRAPLIINPAKRIARQIVLEDAQWQIQHFIGEGGGEGENSAAPTAD
jgi:flagellar assembly factor FliW